MVLYSKCTAFTRLQLKEITQTFNFMIMIMVAAHS